jgi:hypothetical protein
MGSKSYFNRKDSIIGLKMRKIGAFQEIVIGQPNFFMGF